MRPFIRFFLNIRFSSKLLLSYLVVVLIPIMTWVFYSFHQNNSFILEQTKSTFNNISITAQSTFEQKLKKIENAFELITTDTTMVQIINGQYDSNYDKYYDIAYKFDPMINALEMMNTEIMEINIYTNGDIKHARENFAGLDAIQGMDYLSVVNTINPVWIFNEGQLFVAQQVLFVENPDQSAIVSLEIDPDYIFGNNVSSELENYGIVIVDNHGAVVYQEDRLEHPMTDGSLKLDELKAKSRANENMILFHQNTYPQGWEFYMYTDTDSLMIPVESAFQSTLSIIVIIAALIFVVILLFSRTFVKRIAKLNRVLSGVVEGGFETKISSGYKDEIGEMTNSIGKMVKQTKQLIEELHTSHNQQREAEIKALQSQINPHFLYNTLSAINWQAIKSGNRDISKIVIALSAFYRATLNRGDMVTTVQHELDNVRAYLDIQLSLCNHAFDVVYDIEDHILEYNMPNIILQPIVENAIEHGISTKTNGEKGLIVIGAYEQGNDIRFEVSDNGDGMSEEAVKEVLVNGTKGYGIKNVDNRLKLFFDRNYGLTFHPIAPHGTRADITIPKYVHL